MSSSKKNTKGTNKNVPSNGNNVGSKQKNSVNSNNNTSSPPQSQQLPPSGNPSAPKLPNAWSKPLQTKTPVGGGGNNDKNNNNDKPGLSGAVATTTPSKPTASSTTNSSTATPPPPGYKARDNGGTLIPKQPQAPPPTQSSSSAANQNRFTSSSTNKAMSSSSAAQNNTEEALKNRDRSLQLFLVLLGHRVICHLKSGVQLEGVLRTATPFASGGDKQSFVYLLKRTRVVTGDHPTIKPGATVTVPMDQVVQLQIPQVKFSTLLDAKHSTTAGTPTATTSSTSNGFTTDGEISGRHFNHHSDGRSLQAAGSAWTTGGGGGGIGGLGSSTTGPPRLNKRAEALQGNSSASSSSGPLEGSIGTWDQFQANEKLFNVHASYDETMYTTPLDKSQLDSSKIKRAEQLAKEIEAAPSANVHLQQERNQSVLGDFDEEDLHSGVSREVVGKGGSAATETKKKEDATKTVENKGAVPNKDKTPTADGRGGEGSMNYAKALQQAPDADRPTADSEKTKEEQEAKKEDTVKEEKELSAKVEVQPKAEQEDLAPVAPVKPVVTEKVVPPTEVEVESEAQRVVTDTANKTATQDDNSGEVAAVTESGSEDNKSQTSDKPKTRSKLNANAKEFTLNINAKEFTPTFAQTPPPEAQAPQPQQQHHHPPAQQPYDMMVPPPQFMSANAHMGQHGMMPMMGPQYGAIRYASGPFPAGMEQQMHPPQMGQQPQHGQAQPPQGSVPHMVGSPSPIPMQPPHPPPQQQQYSHPPTAGGTTSTSSSLDVLPDQDTGVRTTDSDSVSSGPVNVQQQRRPQQPGPEQLQQPPQQPPQPPPQLPTPRQRSGGGPDQQPAAQQSQQPQQQQQQHQPAPPHLPHPPMQPVPHAMHPQGAYYGTLVQPRGPVPYNQHQPQYLAAPPMYRAQMYAPMAPPKVMSTRPPYYGGPNAPQMAPVPYGGYGGYGGGNEGDGMVDGYGRGGGGRHGGRGRGGRHGQGRGGRHHGGRGGRGGGSNPGGGGRGRGGYNNNTSSGSSGRNTPEDVSPSAVVVSPDPTPPPPKDLNNTTENLSS